MSGNDSIDRLSSWKDIAAWFGVSVRTVQRWEKEEDLPVHRHRHARLSSVFTSKLELEQWWSGRPDLQAGRNTASPQPVTALKATAISLAVLPFVNLSGDQETEVLSDGLSEELTTALSQIESLLVVARTSAFHFKGKPADIRMVGKQLGVELVLEGSVRRSGDRLRISAQLVKASDGYHLWARQFDRRMQDLLDIEEETCRAIVEALRLTLVSSGQEDRFISGYTRDIEAYRLYLKGRHFLAKRLPQALLNAIECFERALVRDPAMAPAYAGLADCHVRLGLPFTRKFLLDKFIGIAHTGA
ncbi:MAG: hypothetical protein IT165_04685 [Bryobacterales bacterium]|nr:hypothetical protein [Bryobacterales bacterium]